MKIIYKNHGNCFFFINNFKFLYKINNVNINIYVYLNYKFLYHFTEFRYPA